MLARSWHLNEARASALPQRPYMPLGTLRQVLCYPDDGETYSDQALRGALERCGLKRLGSRLDTQEQWDQQLSGGEQQRIAFVRLLVQRPDIVIMDEATSALDTDSQDSMMALFRQEMAGVTLISVAHRSELEDYHDRKLMLHRKATGVEMAPVEESGRRERLARLLRRLLRPRPSPDPSSPVSR